MTAGPHALRRHVSPTTLTLIAAGSVALCLAIALYSPFARVVPVDLEVYVMGGRHAVSADLYRVVTTDQLLPFTYPPFAALAFSSLAWLPFRVVEVIWAVVNVAALAAVVDLSLRMVRPELERPDALRWALALSGPALLLEPSLFTITQGQVSFLLLLLVLWDLGGARRRSRHSLPVGVATGVAAAIKLVPLLFVPYLLATRRLREAVTCAATFVACEGLAFAVSPSSSLAYWSKDVFDTSRFGTLYLSLNQSLLAALGRLAHTQLPNPPVVAASTACAVAGVALAAWAHRRSSPALGLIVCGATSLVVSPVSWSYHMVWVIPAIAWLALAGDRPRAGLPLAVATAALFWASPISFVPKTGLRCPCPSIVELHESAGQLVAGNAFFLATVVFLVSVAAMLALRRLSEGAAAPAAPAQETLTPAPAAAGAVRIQ